MAKRERDEETMTTPSCGNVFADLGLPDAGELPTKAKLAGAIHELIDARGLTQAKAAEVMHIDQPRVSKILRGRHSGFSSEWLLQCLLHLGSDIEIVIHKPKTAASREGSITVALM